MANIIKQKAFNEKMGMKKKFPRHQNMAKGGMVKKMADGGPVVGTQVMPQPNTTLMGPSSPGVTQSAASTNTGPAGALAGLLGLNNNMQAGAANLTPGTNINQLNNAYTGVNNAIGTQQNLTNTLVPQANTGVNNQNTLANEYLAMTQGQGPNPALAQLNQATGQNVANQQAMAAGQRGAAENIGLLERQAAQQGANTQQQAAGQAATLESEQQIAAQQNLANLSQNQVNQAGTGAAALTQAQQNEQNTLQGANTALNNANVEMQGNINNVNANTAHGNQKIDNSIIGGVASALGNSGALANIFGGSSAAAGGGSAAAGESAGGAGIGELAGGADLGDLGAVAGLAYDGGDIDDIPKIPIPHNMHFHKYFSGGGETDGEADIIVSPKEVILTPDKVKKVMEDGADPMLIGHHVPGEDKVKGKNSKKNDVVPMRAPHGSVVIPISVTTHKKSSEKGREFVRKAVAKHMKKPKGA